jgi:hypothetical protein
MFPWVKNENSPTLPLVVHPFNVKATVEELAMNSTVVVSPIQYSLAGI